MKLEEAKAHFDEWLAGVLKEFESLIRKVEGTKAGADWMKTVNFHGRELYDSATILGFELIALSPARYAKSWILLKPAGNATWS